MGSSKTDPDKKTKEPGLRRWIAGGIGLAGLLPCVGVVWLVCWRWCKRLRAPLTPTDPMTRYFDLADAGLSIALLLIVAAFVLCGVVVILQLRPRTEHDDDDPSRRDLTGIWGSIVLAVLGTTLAAITMKYAHPWVHPLTETTHAATSAKAAHLADVVDDTRR